MSFPRVQIAVGDVIRCYEVLRAVEPDMRNPLGNCLKWGALTVVKVEAGVAHTDTGSKFSDKVLYALNVCQAELLEKRETPAGFNPIKYVLEKELPLSFVGFPADMATKR